MSGLRWEPVPSRVLALLNNPSYAGAYVFGRFRSSKSLSTDGQIQSRIHEQPIDSWTVLIQDHHRAYISWQEYLENQQILWQNQTNKAFASLQGQRRNLSHLRMYRSPSGHHSPEGLHFHSD